jgi:hypothetical protein
MLSYGGRPLLSAPGDGAVTGRLELRWKTMARGWESKGVEAQIETAADGAGEQVKGYLSPAQAGRLRKKEGLLLSRSRVLRDLETARNPRYRDILREALRHLERELEALVDCP